MANINPYINCWDKTNIKLINRFNFIIFKHLINGYLWVFWDVVELYCIFYGNLKIILRYVSNNKYSSIVR